MSDDCPKSDVSLPNVGGNVASRGSEKATGSAPLGSKKNRGLLLRSRKMRFSGFFYSLVGALGQPRIGDTWEGRRRPHPAASTPASRRGEVDPWCLFAWCKLRTLFLQSLDRGATFKEMSRQMVESIALPVPPLEVQRRLRKGMQELRAVYQQWRCAREQLRTLFQVLLAPTFSDDLAAAWREAHMMELLQEMEYQSKALAEGR